MAYYESIEEVIDLSEAVKSLKKMVKSDQKNNDLNIFSTIPPTEKPSRKVNFVSRNKRPMEKRK